MIFVLFIMIICIMWIAYVMNGKDILSPWIIVCAMFLISTFVFILNISKWKVSILPITVIVIITGLIFFGLGEVTARAIVNKIFLLKGKKKLILINDGRRIEIGVLWILVTYLFMMVVVILSFNRIYQISLLWGNPEGYSLMLGYARNAMYELSELIEHNRILAHMQLISKYLAYFYAFSFIYNLIIIKFVIGDIRYILPIFIYCIQEVLTTNRSGLIHLIAMILILSFILLKKKNNWSIKYDFKIILIGLIVIMLFLILFYLLGTFTGKTKILDLYETISIYVGSSIVALDKYLQEPIYNSKYFGQETLMDVYITLQKLGFPVEVNARPSIFIYWENYSTNIYTMFKCYIQDYSYIGMLIVEFILGFIYGGMIYYIRKVNKITISIWIYASLFYPIVFVSIEEVFMANLISRGTIYQIVYMSFIYIFFIRRKKMYFKF